MLQAQREFLLKRHPALVFRLVLDVMAHARYVGLAHEEGAISVLPMTAACVRSLFRPFRAGPLPSPLVPRALPWAGMFRPLRGAKCINSILGLEAQATFLSEAGVARWGRAASPLYHTFRGCNVPALKRKHAQPRAAVPHFHELSGGVKKSRAAL